MIKLYEKTFVLLFLLLKKKFLFSVNMGIYVAMTEL